MTRLTNPQPIFLDGSGGLLDAGYIYIGAVNSDPTLLANQLPTFWDAALTIAATQPLRTLGGQVVNGATASAVYFAATDYAYLSQDANQILLEYIPSCTATGGVAYQPLDSDLTTISAQTNNVFGLALLALANAGALQAAAGIGTAGLLNEATAAQFRNNTPSVVLTPDIVWGAAAYVPLTPATTVALDLSTGLNFSLAMGGNYTLGAPTNVKEGQSGKILITQDGTGSRTLAYNAAYKPAGGVAPVLSTAANARDILFYEVLPGGGVFISIVKGVPA